MEARVLSGQRRYPRTRAVTNASIAEGTDMAALHRYGLAALVSVGLMVGGTAPLRAQPAPADPELVRIENGLIRGATIGDVRTFKGIPFADPPVGALRWRPPQSVRAWDGVLETVAYRPDCIQPDRETDAYVLAGTAEDCLYLNVWTPATSRDRPLPVLVWIYGGALISGGASPYPGDGLARQGLVVVTLNYRVGRFGFFAHPELARESGGGMLGNYGYLDQIAALRWVQRNVAAFGGDPDKVTIAGESAGGGSVLVLMTSPETRGLFQRAILESPGLPSPRADVTPVRPLAVAETMGVAFARTLGIEGDGAAALAALRALPDSVIARGVTGKAVLAGLGGGPEVPGVPGPILDGRIVVEPPESAVRAGRQARIPVIIGANDADYVVGIASSKDELFALAGPAEQQARALYDPRGDATLEALLPAVFADQTLIEPSRHLADALARVGQPTFFYRFSYVADSLRSRQRGAVHGGEIRYVFDVPELAAGTRTTENDRAMGRTMSAYWAAFVRTGDPNGDDRPHWPRHVPASGEVLDFTPRGVVVHDDPFQRRLDLWQAVRTAAARGGVGR
jgi:para-nitrobenzyl esterase